MSVEYSGKSGKKKLGSIRVFVMVIFYLLLMEEYSFILKNKSF